MMNEENIHESGIRILKEVTRQRRIFEDRSEELQLIGGFGTYEK